MVLCGIGAATGFAQGDSSWVAIFNGRDLEGWDGDSRFWTVRDGVIRGETTLQALPTGNTFLIWRAGAVKDFELKLLVRLQNGNSGVQYRSKDEGNWIVSGYQSEVDNKPGKAGFLYEERGRKYLAHVGETVEILPGAKLKAEGGLVQRTGLILKGYYRAKDWNEYRIVARGNKIEHWVNGFLTASVTDNDESGGALAGLLALQIHSGPPMIVEFKDIHLKNL